MCQNKAIIRFFYFIFMFFAVVNLHKTEAAPLHDALYDGDIETAKKLLQENADVNARNEEGDTPLHCAVSKGNSKIVELLLQHPDVNVNLQDEKGETPLHYAADEDYTEIAKLLLQHKDKADVNKQNNAGGTPLHNAAEASNVEMTRLLLEYAADVNKHDNKGLIPLHKVAKEGNEEDSVKVVRLLLQHKNKTDINKEANDGWTPLHHAVSTGNAKVVKLLLQHKADVDKTENGRQLTPLHLAVKGGKTNIIFLLLQYKADINKKDRSRRAPLDLIPKNRVDIKLLFQSYVQGTLKTRGSDVVDEQENNEEFDNKALRKSPHNYHPQLQQQSSVQAPLNPNQSAQPQSQSPVQGPIESGQGFNAQRINSPAGNGQDGVATPGDDQDTKTLFTPKNLMIGASIVGILSFLLYKFIKKKAVPKAHEEEGGSAPSPLEAFAANEALRAGA